MHDVVSPKTPLTRGLFFGNWRFFTLAFGVLVLCTLPFVPGIEGPFQLDDEINLESIHAGSLSLQAIYQAAFSNDSGMLGRPLSNLSFIANQLAGGYDPFGYKLANVALHLAIGLLILALARSLLPLLSSDLSKRGRNAVALGTAALWTIHPLQVSTVLYVVQRMSQLATLFMVLAIIVALKPLAQVGALPRAADGVRHAVHVGLIAVIALLCKENGALVPFLLLAIALAFPPVTWRLAMDSRGKKTFWLVAVAIPVACAVLVAFLSIGWIQRAYDGREFSLGERLLTQPAVLGGYLKSFFLPDLRTMGLFLDGTPVLEPSDAIAWVGVGLVAATIAAAWLLRRKFPLFAFAVFWFLAAHLMESTVLPLELAFEHRNYLALFGPCLLVAAGVAKLGELARTRVAVAVAVAVLLTFGGLTYMRATTWSDQTRFIDAEVRHHPESLRAQTEAAVLASMRGDNQTAISRIQAAQLAHPDMFFPAAMDMDLGCAIPGYPVDWIRILERVRSNPLDANITSIHKTVALKILAGECPGDITESFEAHLDRVTEIYRDAGMPHQVQFFLMIKADLQTSQQRTRQLLEQAIAVAPDNDSALYRLAYVDLNAGRLAQAAEAIGQLRARTPAWHPSSFRIDELEGFLREARAEERAGRPDGH